MPTIPLVTGISIANTINTAVEEILCRGTSFELGESKLEGCMDQFKGCLGGLRLPEGGVTLGPWVAITFEGSGSTITVGNQSSPNTDPPNIACIKSFEFGYSDGLSCRVVIHDEQGGIFVRFMEHILKHYVCLRDGSPANVLMKVRFGWSKSGCDTPMPVASSRCYYCLCDSVETNFTEGKFVFEITGKDPCSRMFEGGANNTYGGTGDQAIPITQAIRDFMTKGPPPNVGSVRFCKMENNRCVPVEFEDNGIEGPKGKWVANGQDKLRAIMRWLEAHLSKDKKSWIPQYNSEIKNGELIIWEDRRPKCQAEGNGYWDQNCIGTYIVNGSKRSAVLEFNPKIRWDFARLTSSGGNLGSERVNALQTEGSTAPGGPCPSLDAKGNPGAGHTIQTTITETKREINGNNASKKTAEANIQAVKALKILHDNIEADLTIVGNPTILPPSEAMWSKNVTIVLINPYYLTVSGDLACGEWISNPVCNEVLSNKAWICKSITHRIEAGKYTTTIGLYLTAPGIDVPEGSAIGAWSGGWVPPSVC